jgi:hypothetical protein
MNELGAKFLRLEESCLWLEGPDARICILLLGPPPGQAHWADCREEAARQLETALVERHQVDGELEALRTSTTLVQNLVLGKAGRPSHWRRLCLWRRRRLRTELTLRLPMESSGGLHLRWLLSCHIFLN